MIPGGMDTKGEEEGVRAAVRALLLRESRAGSLGSLSHYRGLFPGFESLVEEECARVLKGPTRAGSPPTPVRETCAAPAFPTAVARPEEDRIGPYRVLRELGRGGMGVVYEARDSRLPRKVALKVLSPHFSSSVSLRLRFEREAELASRLDHPHICTVYEAGDSGGTPYLAMRFVEGKTLAELVGLSREAKASSVRLPVPPGRDAPSSTPARGAGEGSRDRDLEPLLLLFEKAARAVHAAHEAGLIHRDIKPHNIMVTGGGEPVLLDFGLAREEEGEGNRLTQTGSLMGTPAYMSPEQLMAQRIRLDRRTDVYSLGVSLYECLTLRLPFEAPTVGQVYQAILSTEPEDPRRINRALSSDLKVVIGTAMAKDRTRRYQSAEDLAEDLRRIRCREPIKARPAGPLTRTMLWVDRNPVVTVLGLVCLVILLGGITSTWIQVRRARVLALIGASAAEEATDPYFSLLLARQAVLESEDPMALDRLREALGEPIGRTVFDTARDEAGLERFGGDRERPLRQFRIDPGSGRILVLPRTAAASPALLRSPTGEESARLSPRSLAPVEERNWWRYGTPGNVDLVTVKARRGGLLAFGWDGRRRAALPGKDSVQEVRQAGGSVFALCRFGGGELLRIDVPGGASTVWKAAENEYASLLPGEAGILVLNHVDREIALVGLDGLERWRVDGVRLRHAPSLGGNWSGPGFIQDEGLLPVEELDAVSGSTRDALLSLAGAIMVCFQDMVIADALGFGSPGESRILLWSPPGESGEGRTRLCAVDGASLAEHPGIWVVADRVPSGENGGARLLLNRGSPASTGCLLLDANGGIVREFPDARAIPPVVRLIEEELELRGWSAEPRWIRDRGGACFLLRTGDGWLLVDRDGVEVARRPPGDLSPGNDFTEPPWGVTPAGHSLVFHISGSGEAPRYNVLALDGTLRKERIGTLEVFDAVADELKPGTRKALEVAREHGLTWMRVSPDQGRIAGRKGSGTRAPVSIFDAAGRELARRQQFHGWAPDGEAYLSSSEGGRRVHVRRDGATVADLDGPEGPALIEDAAAVPGEGGWLLSVWDGSTRLWGNDGVEKVRIPGEFRGLDRQGRRVLTWDGDRHLVHSLEGEFLLELDPPDDGDRWDTAPTALHPGGERMAVWTERRGLLVGDRTGWRSFPAVGTADWTWQSDLRFTPDGNTLLMVGENTVGMVDFTAGEPGKSVFLDVPAVHGDSAALSPDGGLLATFSSEGVVQLWNRDGGAAGRWTAPWGSRASLRFSPSGDLLMGVCGDGVVRCWNMEGVLVATVRERRDPIVEAYFTPDGSRILTGAKSGRGGSWLYRRQDLLDAVSLKTTRDFTDEERERYPGILD